jgi:hypothetical protein
MNNAMNTSTNGNSYPIFAANQVLKYTDLNSLVDYLDQQTRLTRTYLIGIGIVCGLEPSSAYQPGKAQIILSAGCGVTSEGYLIALTETVLTHYQLNPSVPAALFKPTELTPPASPPPPYKLTELFGQNDTNRIPLHQTSEGSQRNEAAFANFLADRVLVVVLELQDAQRDSCLVDCDDRGQDRSFRLRFFLLPRSQNQETSDANLSAESLLRQGYAINQLTKPWSDLSTQGIFEARYTFLKNIHPDVLRFGYDLESLDGSAQRVPAVRLTGIPDYKTFSQKYYLVCSTAITAIDQALTQLFRIFSPFFTSFHPSANEFNGLKDRLIQRLNDIVPTSMRSQPAALPTTEVEPQIEAQYALQYFYDYLSQLVAAYRELVEAAFDLMADCIPETERFPKFLLLGLVPAPGAVADVCAIPSAYRSHFTQPPLYNDNGQRIQQVRHLYDRLLRLCRNDSFNLLPFFDTPLKITPSKDRSVPLSEQAIPYYLNYLNLYRSWSYDDCRKGRSDRHPAYFHPAQSTTPATPNSDLIYRLDEANFYRIEGHIGEANSVALQRIKDYQQQYNLPFDVITLKLDTVASLSDLTISGQFDDLEADFGRMRDKFQKLWMKYNETWADNVFLQTLKRVFFDQTSLADISYTQLFNPILALAFKPDAYDFIKLDATERYHLQLKNAAGTHIARFVTGTESSADLVLDFSGLASDAIATEKKRIQEELTACLGLGKVIFGVERQAPNNSVSYHVRLSVEDELDVPQETASISLLTLNYFSVNLAGGPHITQSEFQDFETLYGLLRDVPEEDADLPFRMGDRHAADCLNYFELKGLMDAYQHRLEKLMQLHLFYKFAQEHPGMEHLGGVPKGGTFILVYVDGQDLVNTLLAADRNIQYQARTSAIKQFVKFPTKTKAETLSQELFDRKDMVIADFCLPYRCWSTTPAVSYLLAQPRPIVLLEKLVFCEGDENRYEFMLDPAGGTLKGEGVIPSDSKPTDGKYYFQPSLITQDIGQEVTITFTYVVEGSYDTLTVSVYPEPEANLSLKDQFCADEKPVPIALTPANPRIEITQLTIAGIDSSITKPVFDPKLYAQKTPQSVEVVAKIRDRLTHCTNTIRKTVTVYPLPDTGFSLDPEPTNGGYCAGERDEGEERRHNIVVLRPDHPGISNRFTADDKDLPDQQIDLNNYAEIKKPVKLKLIHYVTGEGGCTAHSEPLVITIFPRPNANFSLAENVCSNGDPIDLEPKQSGGTFRAFISEDQELPDAISPDQRHFIPKAVPMGNADRVSVVVEYNITGEGGCHSSSRQTVTVHNAPVGTFELAIAEFNDKGFTVRVFNIEPSGGLPYGFDWKFGSGIPTPSEPPRNTDFTVFYSYEGFKVGDTVTISLTVTNGKCSGGPVSKQIAVPFGVRQLWLITISDNGEVRNIPLENNRAFKISEFNLENRYEIEARTLPATVGSVLFVYVDPDGQEQKRPPTNTPPYRMIDGWKPRPGRHGIIAQAFAGHDATSLEGGSLSVSFTIANGDTPNIPAPDGGDVVAVRDRRSSEYQTQFNQLGENSNLRRSRPYQLAEDVLAVDSAVPIPVAIERYGDFTQSLVASYRQSGDDRKAELTQLMAISTAKLLDRLVTDDLDPDVVNRLNEAIATLREVGLDLTAIKAIWKPEDLSEVVDVDRLNRLDELVS